jgi:ABC-type sugar transport system substrate-binding protein
LEPAEVADRYGELSTKYKQIDAVYTADDDMMLGAMQAYKESGEKT